jgi:hypothetical protein
MKTFYIYQNFAHVHVPNHERVADLLRECSKVSTTEDELVDHFISRLSDVQLARRKRKNSRVCAIVYKWYANEYETVIEFNFSRFIDRTGKEQYKKSGLRDTARSRFDKCPRVIVCANKNMHMTEVKQKITSLMGLQLVQKNQ